MAGPPAEALAKAGGGAGEDRTPDLLIANEALSQLSYGPATSPDRPGNDRFGRNLRRASRPFTKAAPAVSRSRGAVIRGGAGKAAPRSRRLAGPGQERYTSAGFRLTESPQMIELLNFIAYLLLLYMYVVIAAVVFSWLIAFNVVNTRSPFVSAVGEFLYRVTDPLLRPIRNALPNLGGIDISPLILILIIMFVINVAIPVLARSLT